MKSKHTWPIIYALMLIVALGLLIYYIPLSHSKNTISSLGYPADLSSGWYTKSNGNTKDVNIKWLNHYTDDNSSLTIYYTLPGSDSSQSNVLALHTANISFNLYVDDELKHSHGLYNKSSKLIHSPGRSWDFIEIPASKAGATVRMNISTYYNDGSECISEAYYGNSAVILLQIIKDNALNVAICIILAFFGLVFMITHLVNNYILKFNINTFYIGLFAFLCAVWSACHTPLTLLFLNDVNLLNIFERILILILPLPLMLHIERNFKIYNTTLHKLGYIFLIVNFFAQLTICFTGIFDFHEMMQATYFVILYCSIVILCSIHSDRKLKIKKDVNTFFDSFILAGFIVFLTGILIDVLCAALTSATDSSACIRYTLLLLVIAFFAKLLREKSVYSQQYSLSKSMHKLAYTDALTELGNRTSFTSTLLETELVKRQFDTLAIFIFDVNYLKYVNDNFGHQHGDKLIISCADTIKKVFGADFKLFRIGGDEFAAIYAGTASGNTVQERLNQFRAAVAEFNKTTAQPFELSVAVGVAFMNPSRTETTDELFKRADRLMYDNKKEMKRDITLK